MYVQRPVKLKAHQLDKYVCTYTSDRRVTSVHAKSGRLIHISDTIETTAHTSSDTNVTSTSN